MSEFRVAGKESVPDAFCVQCPKGIIPDWNFQDE